MAIYATGENHRRKFRTNFVLDTLGSGPKWTSSHRGTSHKSMGKSGKAWFKGADI